ncbi:MAG: response regulator, partial [Roseiflexus sp.]|uniref:response regulator n=1 Tax=Roseiflexus sp. TaxID=2562120 RepID=UPI0025DD2700
TDLQMPGMDGVELYERLHALRPSLRWLILTGDTMGERSSLFLERTGLPVLHKPFTQDQLIERLAESLHHNPSSPL